MAIQPHTPGAPQPSLAERVRLMRERNAPRRETVLRSIERLREIAAADRRKR